MSKYDVFQRLVMECAKTSDEEMRKLLREAAYEIEALRCQADASWTHLERMVVSPGIPPEQRGSLAGNVGRLRDLCEHRGARIEKLKQDVEDLVDDIEHHIAIASQQAGRIAELEDANRWRDISEVPCPPCAAELFVSEWPFRDDDEPPQDSRRHLAFWTHDDGWRDMETGEVLCVSTGNEDGWYPTHWRPLPPPPETTDEC